eukprot:969901-Rhodomonas_salina.1
MWLGRASDCVTHTAKRLETGERMAWARDVAFLHYTADVMLGQAPHDPTDSAASGRALAEACRQHLMSLQTEALRGEKPHLSQRDQWC